MHRTTRRRREKFAILSNKDGYISRFQGNSWFAFTWGRSWSHVLALSSTIPHQRFRENKKWIWSPSIIHLRQVNSRRQTRRHQNSVALNHKERLLRKSPSWNFRNSNKSVLHVAPASGDNILIKSPRFCKAMLSFIQIKAAVTWIINFSIDA